MAGRTRSAGKPKKPLRVKKVRLGDLPAKHKEPTIKGGFAPPYTPTKGSGTY